MREIDEIMNIIVTGEKEHWTGSQIVHDIKKYIRKKRYETSNTTINAEGDL